MKFRLGKEELFLVLAIAGIALYALVIKEAGFIQSILDTFWRWMESLSETQGYLGGFVAAFLANFSIIIPIPYTVAIFFIGATGLNPLLLGLISGIGAGLGEGSSYFLGFFGHYVTRQRYEKNARILRRIIEHRPLYIHLILFLIGATPIPDDVFVIPLGFIRYGFIRTFIPVAMGKIIITTILAYLGSWSNFSLTLDGQASGGIPVDIITLVGSVLAIYAVLKVDWDRIGNRLIGEKTRE